MSALTIFTESEATTPVWYSMNAVEIADKLRSKGVRFERWHADRDLGIIPILRR